MYNNNIAATYNNRYLKEITLETAIIIAVLLHILIPIVGYGLLMLLMLLGINLSLFPPPEPKAKDIEFKLVNNIERKPLAPTNNRAERDSSAGGKHNPNMPESQPEPKAGASASPKQQVQQPKPQKPVEKQRPVNKPVQPKQRVVYRQKPVQQNRPEPREPKEQKPPSPAPMPFVHEAPKPAVPVNQLAPPISVASAPKPVGPTAPTGPITQNKSSSSSSSSSDGGPAPISMSSPVVSSSSGSSSGSSPRTSSGSGRYGSGSPGNPSPGNPNAPPGINAKRDPDFGPYMAELQRRIKRNWQPPRRNQSKRVVLLFTVAKSGRLLNLRVNRSSGEPDTDKAAISAVQLAAPFRPLPSEFSGDQIDIQFTFDYNVFGVGGRTF